jgi:hypothetical protein
MVWRWSHAGFGVWVGGWGLFDSTLERGDSELLKILPTTNKVLCWVPVALRPAPIPPCLPSGPPGASCIPRVPSGPSDVSLDPPVCPPVPLVSLGSYSSIVIV